MKKSVRSAVALAVPITVFAGLAHAHSGHAEGAGLVHGLLHPLLGPDHMLAAFAVGLWAAQQAAGMRLRGPALFLGALTGGAALVMAGLALPWVEPVVAASLLALGLLAASATRLPPAPACGLIAGFGLFHGAAHVDALVAAAGLGYFAGLVLTSAVILALGLGTGRLLQRPRWGLRLSGLVVAGAGVLLWPGLG